MLHAVGIEVCTRHSPGCEVSELVSGESSDPHESELPSVGLVDLRDAETGRTRVVDTSSPGFRSEFERIARERVERLERCLRADGIDFVQIDAAGSVVDPLVRFFRMRERRQHR